MRRFLPYFRLLRPVRWQFTGALIAGSLNGVTNGFGLPFLVDKVFPKIFGETPPDSLVLLGAVAILPAVFLVRGLSGFANAYLINYCGIRVLRSVQIDVYRKVQFLPLQFFHANRGGDLLARIMGDSAALQSTLTTTANSLVRQPLTFIAAVGTLIYLSLRHDQMMFLVYCVVIIPVVIGPMRFTGRKLLSRATQLQNQAGSVMSTVQENLSAAKEVRVFNLEDNEIEKFRATLTLMQKFQMKVVKYASILGPFIEFVSTIGVAAAIFYAARSGLTLEVLIPMVIALFMSYQPLKSFGVINNQLKAGVAAIDRLEYISKHEDDLADPTDPLPLDSVRGEIELRDVSFSYSKVPVLHDVNERIDAGEIVALVGPSGAGKTTFVNLIPRLYDAERGAILVDGVDVRRYRKRELRSQIAIVSQDPVLFNDTIANNIRIGKQSATDAEVAAAAREAFADEFIDSMEQGYKTKVGDRGVRLSGGQRQRLAIARAFLKDAPILILDEATSSLDAESEAKIQEALTKLVMGRTTLIIAHRFSTLKVAQRILVFESGRIVARGSHDELFAGNDLYRNLYERQL